VVPISELAGKAVDQVCIGSCTNSSYRDLMTVAGMLRGKKVNTGCSLTISPGSRQVFEMIARNGALGDIIGAGARILECACGPCIGMGQSPPSAGTSVRTFNRNFLGRSGTKDADVYLVSPEVAVAAALRGEFTDPRELDAPPDVAMPEEFLIDDAMVIPPAEAPATVEILRGPNIKPCPIKEPLSDEIRVTVLLVVGDNITTDHIMPAGAKILPLRSNIPAISEHVFEVVDPTFPDRARTQGGGFIVGGENYGQGSSREHAALAPMYLGIQAVFAKSFARIHKSNLVNFGILPLNFEDPADYETLDQGDELVITGVLDALDGNAPLTVRNATKGTEFAATYDLSDRQRKVLKAGGLLNHTKETVG
jgi:aconitate hydratase